MMATTTLLDLPPELLTRIGSYLTTAELGPFRRACKQIEAGLFDAFASEFFTKRQFMIEHNSLEALVGIANHEGLASRLTEVLIGTQCLIDKTNWPADDYLASRPTRDAFIASGKARDMLVEAFSKLPNLRTVGLRDYDGSGRARDGPRSLWRSWGHSQAVRTAEDTPHPLFAMIMLALAQAGARPTNVEVILRKTHLTSDSMVMVNEKFDSRFPALLSHLKVLFLALSQTHDLNGVPSDDYVTQSHTDAPLRLFTHSLSNIEHLRLNFLGNQNFANRYLHWLGEPAQVLTLKPSALPIPSAGLPNLTTLELGMGDVLAPTLTRVLTKFTGLKSFSLWRMTIHAQDPLRDSWASFFLDLSDGLPDTTRLRTVLIGHLAQRPFDKSVYMGDIRVSFVPEGTDQDKKHEAQLKPSVEYKAQYTGQTVQQWLRDLAELTFVPGIPTRPPPSESEDSEIDEDMEEDEVDEVEDNDD